MAIIFIVWMVLAGFAWVLFDGLRDGGFPVVAFAGEWSRMRPSGPALLLSSAVVDQRVHAVVEVLSVREGVVLDFLLPLLGGAIVFGVPFGAECEGQEMQRISFGPGDLVDQLFPFNFSSSLFHRIFAVL